jgi:hypothetical protein
LSLSQTTAAASSAEPWRLQGCFDALPCWALKECETATEIFEKLLLKDFSA